MKSSLDIEKLFKDLHDTTSAEMDERVLRDASQALEKPNRSNIWRIIMKTRVSKFAAAAVIIISILIGINQFGGSISGSSVAFGEVLEYIQTFSYTFDLTIEPVSVGRDFNTINAQAMVIEPGKFRLNWLAPMGEVSSIVDYNRSENLKLFHRSKLGMIGDYRAVKEGPFGFFNKFVRQLWNLKDGSEERLGEKEIYGHTVTGFKVVQDDELSQYDITIWVDSQDGFPVLVDVVIMSSSEFSTSTRCIMKNFDFDIELDEELFSFDIPAGYTLVNQSGSVIEEIVKPADESKTNLEVENDVSRENAPGLLIKPLEGVGAVKFGMTCEQIIEILGEPDQFIGKHCLDYTSSAGLSLLVHPKRGLLAIDCWSQEEKLDEGHLGGRDFVGETDKGIGINSTKDEIVRQYGNEYKFYLKEQPDIFELYYPQLTTIFRLKNKKVIHISIDVPK